MLRHLLAGIFETAALAQHHGHPGGAASPYATHAIREIKALSAEQLADLRKGRGFGITPPMARLTGQLAGHLPAAESDGMCHRGCAV